MEIRAKPLSDPSLTQYKWRRANPLFLAFEAELERVFERGVAHDSAYYVQHPMTDGGTFERDFAKRLVPSRSDGPTGAKVQILRGPVGSGKTCFVRRVAAHNLQIIAPTVLPIYIDAYRRVTFSPTNPRPLVNRFNEAAMQAMSNRRLFATHRDCLAAIFGYLGFENLSDAELIARRKDLEALDVVNFILGCDRVDGLVIVIDNIDEGSSAAVEHAMGFVHQLAEAVDTSLGSFAILLPLREYQVNRFSDTRRYAVEDLPPLDPQDVVTAAIRHAQDVIKMHPEEIEFTIDYHTRRGRDVDVGAKTVKVGAEGLQTFLSMLAHEFFDREQLGLRKLLADLASGNMKILISNTFNLLQSCKLPLLPLVDSAFTPRAAVETIERNALIPFHLGVECLMAVRYPFFDVPTSHIMNVFHVTESGAPNDFQNTLTIPRILMFLRNGQELTLGAIFARFHAIGYNRAYIEIALAKCLQFGLLRSSHGICMKDLDEKTTLRLSSAGRLYVENLMFEPTYLGLACEDTEMPDAYRVPIGEKYASDVGHGNRDARVRAIRKFVDFVAAEERLEHRSLDERGIAYEGFLRDFATGQDGQRQLISGRMKPMVEMLSRIVC